MALFLLQGPRKALPKPPTGGAVEAQLLEIGRPLAWLEPETGRGLDDADYNDHEHRDDPRVKVTCWFVLPSLSAFI